MKSRLLRLVSLSMVMAAHLPMADGQVMDQPNERVTVRDTKPPPADQRDAVADASTVELENQLKSQTSIGRVIDDVVGLRVREAGGTGRRETVQLRGGSGQQVAVYLDDVRLTSSRGGATDLSQLPILGIERVHIVRGAASAAYGSGAQSGLIRLVTQPVNEGMSAATLRLGSVGLHQLDGAIGGAAGPFDGFIGVRLSDSEGHFPYRDANGQSRLRANNDHRRWGVVSKGRWKLSDGQTLTLLVDGLMDDRGEPGSSQFPNAFARSADQRLSGTLAWRMNNLVDGRLQTALITDLTVRRYQLDNPGSTYQPGQRDFRMSDEQAGLTLEMAWEGSRLHRPQVFVEGRYEQAHTQATPGQAQPSHAERGAGAASLSWAWMPWRPLTVQPVLRVDARTGRDPIWVPKIGVRWTISPVWSVSTNMGRIFRDPSFDELYFESVGLSGDADLAPEDGIGFDASVRLTAPFSWPLNLQATWFQQRYDRIILFVPIDAYRIQATDRFAAQNVGLETALSLGRSHWLRVAYTHQKPRFSGATNTPLPLRPVHLGHLRLTAPWRRAQPTIRLSAQSSMTADRFGHRRLPGYVTVDLGLGIDLAKPIKFVVELRNLTDERSRFDAVHQPRPGRSCFIELRWRS
ncbi:MAG: TonB-dependent receptor [Myxococcota bacterium]|nr:TonB-dependent receptor [Myxococcota bacterium]